MKKQLPAGKVTKKLPAPRASSSRRPGRPPSQNPRSGYVQIRVTEEEFVRFHDAAEKQGIALSQWIRMLARGAAGM